jgi:hypothetical protein
MSGRTPGTPSRPLRAAPPAFLFFGVFSGRSEILDEARRLIEERFGALHAAGASATFPFPETRTYRHTMGGGLQRRFFVLAELFPQNALAPVKRLAITLEEEIRRRFPGGVARPVNIDPGLINDCRVILASTKDYAHRIYRGDGIWEEVTLIFRHGAYRPLPWTYPDFQNPEYHEFFARFRKELLERHRELSPDRGGP